MRKLAHVVPLSLMLLGALMVFQQQALAYTDPGTGLLAIQAAGSALVAAGWVLRKKVSSLFHRRTEDVRPEAEPPVHAEKDPSLR
jgi:hypothetical protein